MVHPTKIVIAVFCLFVFLFGIGAFISPYVKLDERSQRRSKCRKEIALIRDFLRNSNSHMELDFIDWRTNACADANISTAAQMSRYCWIVCERTSTTFLDFHVNDGDPILIDTWGEAYNIAETNKLPVLKRCKTLGSWNVGPFIIWSSGPNRRNEYGDGDDIIGMRR